MVGTWTWNSWYLTRYRADPFIMESNKTIVYWCQHDSKSTIFVKLYKNALPQNHVWSAVSSQFRSSNRYFGYDRVTKLNPQYLANVFPKESCYQLNPSAIKLPDLQRLCRILTEVWLDVEGEGQICRMNGRIRFQHQSYHALVSRNIAIPCRTVGRLWEFG